MMTRIGALMRKGWPGFSRKEMEVKIGAGSGESSIRVGGGATPASSLQAESGVRTREDCLAAPPMMVWPAEACRAVRELKIQLEELEIANDFLHGRLADELLNRQLVSMSDILESVREDYADVCRAKGLTVTVNISSSVPARMFGDPERLRRILTHLVDNAVRFSDQGQIRVEVDTMPHPDSGTVRLSLTVFDTGQSPTRQQSSCETEPSGAAEGDQTIQGRGLALAVVRKLIGLMDGQMRIQSLDGAYTSVNCSVNLKRSAGKGTVKREL
ncbi:sensor histidine kinase [Desulfonatronum parangueonense]